MDKQIYIKPTRQVHDSGFRTFEVGYIIKMDDKNKVIEKQVVSTGSDHVYSFEKHWGINMDLTMDGYIRFWSHDGVLSWESWVGSDAEIVFTPKK